jgi:hypothetical protein
MPEPANGLMKRKYERPILCLLGELARGAGQSCNPTGTNAGGACNPTGTAASAVCNSGIGNV